MALSNFSFLRPYDDMLADLGEQAERLFPLDANACLFKLRWLNDSR